MTGRIRIATTESAARLHHYQDVVSAPEFEWLGQIKAPFSGDKLRQIQAIIVSDEYWQPSRLAIAACRASGIPTFHVMDGIVEWRNLYENPRTAIPENGAPLFQPLMSDLTFTMGHAQKTVLQWLGNTNVVATGLPRLDDLTVRPCRTIPAQIPARLLIATANTPWFDAEQESVFRREFSRLVSLLTNLPVTSRPVSCTWRIAQVVAQAFNLVVRPDVPVAVALAECDALITTPSTLAVEAMLQGVPVLVFDPFACPPFTPSAWSATSAEGVIQLLPSLLAPCPNRCRLQDSLCHAIAPSDGGAAKRVAMTIQSFLHDRSVPDGVESSFDIGVASKSTHSENKSDGQSMPSSVVEAMLKTIPSLDATISNQRETIAQLHRQLAAPGVKQSLLGFARSVKRTLAGYQK